MAAGTRSLVPPMPWEPYVVVMSIGLLLAAGDMETSALMRSALTDLEAQQGTPLVEGGLPMPMPPPPVFYFSGGW